MGLRRTIKVANIMTNTDYAKGTTGWSGYLGTVAIVNGVMTITGNGAGASPEAYQSTGATWAASKRLYGRATMRVDNTACAYMRLEINPGTSGSNNKAFEVATPTQNQWYATSGICTQTNQVGVIQPAPRHYYADAATANGKKLEVLPSSIVVIDISTLPAELQALSDAALKAVLDTWPWFDGAINGGRFGGRV